MNTPKTVIMDQIVGFKNNEDIFASQTLPLQAAYKLNKIRKQIDKEVDFYQKKFSEIVNEYSKKDENGRPMYSEDGSQILIEDGRISECNDAILELSNLEITIDTLGLKIEDFGEMECTADELDALMPFLNE